jgi:cbb3-type cytochrome oxidase maturation protein
MSLVIVWVAWSIFGGLVFSAMFIWAVRTRQFTEMDRQRYIALRGAQPNEGESDGLRLSLPDRYIGLILAALALGMLIATFWVGLRSS